MTNVINHSRLRQLSRRSFTGAGLGLGLLVLLHRDGAGLSPQGERSSRMVAELLRAAERAGTCTAANAVGVGLRGEYFAEPALRGSALLVRVDGLVDFDQALEWPADNAARPLSVRWSGWIKPPLGGLYRFHADTPNMRVLVARQVVAGAGAAPDATVDMAAGRFYPIEVEVNRLEVSAGRIRLEWTAPHGARYVVPRALLHLPTETVSAPRV